VYQAGCAEAVLTIVRDSERFIVALYLGGAPSSLAIFMGLPVLAAANLDR
jgi:hypothetical protein